MNHDEGRAGALLLDDAEGAADDSWLGEGPERTHTLPGTLLLLFMAALVLFDRPVAVLSVPGVPIYPAEIVLGVATLYLLTRRSPFRGLRTGNWMAPVVLLVWLAWGLLKLVASLHYPILDVVRDSALVYYALFAVVVVGLARFDSRFEPPELLRLYGRLVPWLLAVAPFRIIGAAVFDNAGPSVPGSSVLLTSHRPGNLGCAVGLSIVYLASSGRRDRMTALGVVVGFLTLLLIGTQNRGGLLSGSVAILVALVLWRRHIKLRLGVLVLVLLSVGLLAWSLNLRFQAGVREVSVNQLTNNISSVVGGGNDQQGSVNSTVDFRETLWHRALGATVRTGQLETGWGFGPNLGSSFLPYHSDQELRNPHNSHMTVIVRLGLVGLAIWVVLWLSWLRRVLRRARRSAWRRAPWTDTTGRLALMCGAGVSAFLFNAYVDPTLETPMVAVWLWSLFGFGMLAVADRRPPAPERDPEPLLVGS